MLRTVQGATRIPLRLTWVDTNGAAVDLTGATITARMTNDGTTVRAVTGSLNVVNPGTAGQFDWDFSAADVATAGVWQVQFTATFSGNEYHRSFSALLTIDEAL